ncbi:hypothetical protein HK100_011702 [Physocladia obscura]|uniref:Aminotransferase class V domain-containing protein n=1 Tax=Physocladia obscura TaxID=109957 RepID=A0AAD5XGS6_9FUNG|nr:hypothetical protein HK100_011702 [Physocladia obscura]
MFEHGLGIFQAKTEMNGIIPSFRRIFHAGSRQEKRNESPYSKDFRQSPLPSPSPSVFTLHDPSTPQELYDMMLNLPSNIKRNPHLLVEFLHSDMILASNILTPFGKRPLIYADFIASGRSLRCIEHAIQNHILPFYANTHTETGLLGRFVTDLRESARDIIKSACGGERTNSTESKTSCIFVGSGTTAGLNRLAHLMGLNQSNSILRHCDNVVVFVSSAEHNSNLLVWRESGAKVVSISTDPRTGLIRLDELESRLQEHVGAAKLIGSFTAGSNIVGVIQPVHALARLMHKFNGFAFFDFAATGPYVSIDMCPINSDSNDWLDAVIISPHKFIGGPGTPGVLLLRNCILPSTNNPPVQPGGGTVVWVDAWGSHTYVSELETREEAGTPDVIGAIRAGFAFHIKTLMTAEFITATSQYLASYAISRLLRNKNIALLGPHDTPRLPIFSIMVKSPIAGKYLHHHFVSRVLGDVFGIQQRSGCSCAGVYLNELTDAPRDEVIARKRAYLNGFEGVKPGFTRFNLSYTHTMQEVEYILDAIDWIGTHGYKLLPLYKHDENGTANWVPRAGDVSVIRATVAVFQNSRVPLDFEGFSFLALNELKKISGVNVTEEEQGRENSRKEKCPHPELLDWYAKDIDIFL